MTKTKISVVMPSLNVINYIAECMESILNQTLANIEIICVDAGSDDGTYELLQEYQKRDNRVKVIKSEIKSYGYQVNLGIKKASSKYISIVETDDFIENDMLERLYDISEKKELEFVKGDYNSFYIDKNDNIISNCVKMFPEQMRDWYGKVINPRDCPILQKMGLNIWRGIYNRQFVIDNNLWLNETDGAAFQDISFYHRLIMKSQRAMFIEDPFYNYRNDRQESSFRNKNTLTYVYHEYKSIIESEFKYSDNSVNHLHYIYIKMANEFLTHIYVYVEFNDSIHKEIKEDKCVKWIIKQLREAKEKGMFYSNDFSADNWSQLVIAISNIDMYIDFIRVKNQNLLDTKKKYNNILKNYKIVLFGVGNYGTKLINILLRNNCQVIAVCDNLKYNNKFYGYDVLKPKDCVKIFPTEYYIIANKFQAENMKDQLESLGVKYDKILLFSKLD